MSKLVKDVSRDRGMLHMKMVIDTTETKKYVKQLPEAFEKVSNNLLLQVMKEVMKETQTFLRGYNTRRGDSSVWKTSQGQRDKAGMQGAFRSHQTATKKIADSLKVAETRAAGVDKGALPNQKGTAAVSMWSQDFEFASHNSNFTSAGVRGSRAKQGKKFEGKIAEYYEQGRTQFPITSGRANFSHPGYPKLAYMAKSQEKTTDRFRAKLDDIMQNKLAPNAVYDDPSTKKARLRQVGQADYDFLKSRGVIG